MRKRVGIIVFAFGLHISTAAIAAEPVTIGLIEFAGTVGVSQETANMLAEVISGEIAKMGDVRVITKSDIISMLNLEKQRRLAGCSDDACFAEISGTLGVRWMVTGAVGKVGRSYILNLKLLDAINFSMASKVSKRIKGDEDDLLDALPEATQELFDKVAGRLDLHLPERITAAAKHSQPITESPSPVIVITSKDIEESGATSFLDLLRRYPALYVMTILPSNNMVHLRGSYRVLLLLDGRELNMEVFPPPFYELMPVGIHDIDRIEIVLGPNSALYGANAVSAVINVITRDPRPDFHSEVSLAAGQNGNMILDGSAGGGVGPWAFKGSFGINREHSWMDPHEVPRDLVYADTKAHLSLGEGRLAFNAGLLAGDLRLFSDALGYGTLDELVATHTKADLEIGGLKARAYWCHFNTKLDIEFELVHPDMGIRLGTIPTMEFTGDTTHLDAQYALEPFENNFLIVGADFWYTIYRSDQLVKKEVSEIRTGVFVHDEHRFGDWLLVTLGVRADFNTKTKTAISPKAALVFNPIGQHYIRLSGGTAFRKPVVLETSGNFRIDAEPGFESDMERLFEDIGISNPDLDNEILTTVELGYLGYLLEKKLRLEANICYANNRKTVTLNSLFVFNELMQLDFERTEFGYSNSEWQEHIVGFNFSVEGDLLEELTLYLRGEIHESYFTFRNQYTANDLNDHLRAAAGGVLRLPFGLTASLAVIYAGEYQDSLVDPKSVLAPELWMKTPERVYLLAHLSYRIDLKAAQMDLGLSFFNPFGAHFREKLGTVVHDGSNYGGELMGPRAMVTARIRY